MASDKGTAVIVFGQRWKRVAAALAMLVLAAGVCAQPTVIIVRHGEKADEGKDPALSAAGMARAEHLASMLATSGVTVIYTTQFRRTQLLAQPLAKRIGVAPTVVAAADGDALIRQIQARRVADTVLVVGHSNTVPAIIKALGVREEVKVADDEYDNIFVVVPSGTQTTVLKMKY